MILKIEFFIDLRLRDPLLIREVQEKLTKATILDVSEPPSYFLDTLTEYEVGYQILTKEEILERMRTKGK